MTVAGQDNPAHDVQDLPMIPSPTRSYAALHEHLDRLARAGLLHRIDAPVNKDTEMHPLVRWQFRGGIAEQDRRAFLFTNIVDSKGRRYDIPVVVGAFATNPEVYRIGMNVATLDAIGPAWERAIAHPIAPRVVETAPCQYVVITRPGTPSSPPAATWKGRDAASTRCRSRSRRPASTPRPISPPPA